jgi:hypothetical protein
LVVRRCSFETGRRFEEHIAAMFRNEK